MHKSHVDLSGSYKRQIVLGGGKKEGGELRSSCNRLCESLLEFEVKQ